MSIMGQPNKRRGGALFALLALIAIIAAVPLADAAGSSVARAGKPVFNKSAVRLMGVGAYASRERSASVTVTVCLQKRTRGSFINIRCRSRHSGERSVKARVSVPGCVRGAWRTSTVGQATTRSGGSKLPAAAVSGVYRC